MRFFLTPTIQNWIKKTDSSSDGCSDCAQKKHQPYLKLCIPVCLLGNLFFWTFPQSAQAVLPPDLIVSAGAQVAGVFSVLVAVFVSVCASVAVVSLAWYQWFKQWSVHIAFGILALALVVSNAVTLYLVHKNAQIDPPSPVVDAQPAGESGCDTCQFYSDSITFFVPDAVSPTVVELDLNRKQEADGSYSHYYFLDGLSGENKLNLYTQFISPARTLLPHSFLTQIERIEPEDASVRAIYTGEVETRGGRRISFTTSELQGDFVTRNTPEYTQLQSPVTAQLRIDGKETTAYGLVESLHSVDYNKWIFFPEYYSVQAKTHQFVLWDEEGSFYMIDDSQVFSDTKAYPSHSWLLYKDASTGQTQKGFVTTITSEGEDQWQVTVPDFLQGNIRLRLVQTYQPKENGRTRHIVSGVVTDERGERQISGMLRIVE